MAQDDRPGSPRDELQEALRDLARQQRRAPSPTPGEEVAEAVERIAERQREERRRRPPSRWARAKWPAMGVATLALVVVCVIVLWPEPLPPAAESATEAVEGFWRAIIGGRYEAATVYCPSLVDRYGSRAQAARFLKGHFSSNPPTMVRNVTVSGTVPDSLDLIVDYEVIRRSGSPFSGQAVVTDTGDRKQGYVIVSGI